MSRLPRLALSIPPDGREPVPATLAVLAGLSRAGWRVQHFRAQARPYGSATVGQITGLPGRHLDPWLMPPETCREVFARGCGQAELMLVEGCLSDASEDVYPVPCDRPGRLGPLIEALNLPTVAVLPCPRGDLVHLPEVPAAVDAVILDGLEVAGDFERLRHLFGLIVKKPVIGAIESLNSIRRYLQAYPSDEFLAEPIIDRLATSFLRYADLPLIRRLSQSRPYPPSDCSAGCGRGRRLRVAYAQDEAFGGYYPDTLEMLEALGAELTEFSPLRDEKLPVSVDLVMIGCGYPDRFAEELAGNLSLIASLKHHVCHGLRIYSEGGGSAYLGRSMILGDRVVQGAGILPFDAVLSAEPTAPQPVTRVLVRESWLGPQGTAVRGYRSGRWTLRPAPDPMDCPARSGVMTREGDLYFRNHAIGSLIHLHLAALPQVVQAFIGPHRPSLALPQPDR